MYVMNYANGEGNGGERKHETFMRMCNLARILHRKLKTELEPDELCENGESLWAEAESMIQQVRHIDYDAESKGMLNYYCCALMALAGKVEEVREEMTLSRRTGLPWATDGRADGR